MNPLLRALAISLTLTALSTAETCREVVRDSSGRVVQTIDHQKSSNGGALRSVIRDASGRTIGTSTSQTSGTTTRTDYRDASGRMTGSATTNGSSPSTGNGSCPAVPRLPMPLVTGKGR